MRRRRLEGLVAGVRAAASAAELASWMTEAARALGFDYVALVRHADLLGAAAPQAALDLVAYPDPWRARLAARRDLRDDPVLAACRRTAAPFLWSELARLGPLSTAQSKVLAEAAESGLGEGFTVPVAVPGAAAGSCSYALAPGRPVPRAELPAAHYIGCIGFEAARRILAPEPAPPPLPRLSKRQLECLTLAAQGKSDWDIARLLGIARHTVHQHMEAAKRRYGVATRAQLVVRALFACEIIFPEVLA
ncbi:MAG: LuxR family transcriptional regulator [Alphaproteobacteria bacterium]|nr:LuxR family transcriptional regulator [Alphaproteobacteria bacterium]